MSEASDYLEISLTDHIFRTDWTPKATYTIALCTSLPVDSEHGGTITEVNYTSYTRVAFERATAWWNQAGASTPCDNATAIVFPAATGGASDAAWFAILEGGTALAGGTSAALVCYGALTATLSISNGITPQFPAGDLDITVS